MKGHLSANGIEWINARHSGSDAYAGLESERFTGEFSKPANELHWVGRAGRPLSFRTRFEHQFLSASNDCGKA